MAMDWLSEQAPFPFVWWDVAAVCLVSAWPLAIALAQAIRKRVSVATALGLAALTMVASTALFASVAPANLAATNPSLLATGGLVRGLFALGLTTGVLLACFVVFPPRRAAGVRQAGQPTLGMFLLGAIVLPLLPTMYIQARCQHDAARAVGLIEQTRLGEARTLLRRLVALSPRTTWKGTPLRQTLAQTEQTIGEVESRVAEPLPEDATDQERLERARELAILSREQEAIDVLHASASARTNGEAMNLLGTIYEARGKFKSGLESYQQGRGAWERQPVSAARTEGLIQASRGIGYCARKLGRNADAEAAYLNVLELSPTADTHFLLARFYEDIEHTRKAEDHARLAMKLAPDRYQAEGDQLLDKLMMRHFGCFGVFRSDQPK